MTLNKPTNHLPKIFDCYAIIAFMVGCFIFGFYGLLFLIGAIFISIGIHKSSRHKSKNQDVILICLLLMIFSASPAQKIFDNTSYINDKQKLSKTLGIIPKKANRVLIGRSSTYYFLTVHDWHFSCSRYQDDPCDAIYDYQGEKATIYFQELGEYRNLVYEIVVNGKTVYQFDEQLSHYLREQKITKQKSYLFFALYGIPMLLFVMLIIMNNKNLTSSLYMIDKEGWLDKYDEYMVSLSILGALLVVVGLGWYLLNF